MRKGIHFFSLLLTAAMCISTPCVPKSMVQVFAEEEYEAEYEEETAAAHQDAYYDEIQTNNIAGWPQGPMIETGAAIVMDAKTNAVLYGKNIEQQNYPASITKLMTTLLALEYGKLDDVVDFSVEAVYSIEYGSSHLGLTEGEQLTLEQCLYGIMMASANEISNAVAEHIGGDIDTFVQMMNDKAAELGCTGTHFVNVHGLHDENHYVTAKDMALITQEVLKYDKFREIIGTEEYHYDETNLVDEKRYFINHHKMMLSWEPDYYYEGCLGGKTGYTDQAWNTLVTIAERDGMELICVVLRTPGLNQSYWDTTELLDYAFDNFKEVEVSTAGLQAADVKITGVEDQTELGQIQSADLSQAPFALANATVVTVPNTVDTASLTPVMDFTDNTLSYSYEGEQLGTSNFVYTGQWEQETETELVTEAVTEAETISVAATDGFVDKAKDAGKKALDMFVTLYEKMDEFITENTVVAAVIGAILLLIFIPLLLVAINRSRKYRRIQALREEELEIRRRLEAEIEEKSAAQIEAELRAEALQRSLEEEKKRRQLHEEEVKEIENAQGFYLDEEEKEAATESSNVETDDDGEEPEDEYIEVTLEEAEAYFK